MTGRDARLVSRCARPQPPARRGPARLGAGVRLALLIFLTLFLGPLPPGAFSQEAITRPPEVAARQPLARDDGPRKSSSIQYRRVFVPADRPEDWPVGKLNFRPTDPKEFEDLARRLEASPSSPALAGARLPRIRYQARLEQDFLVEGQALCEITADGPDPTLLTLHPCPLTLTQVAWVEPLAGPAIWGLNAEQKLAVLVKHSGTLQINWTLRGRRLGPEGLFFSLFLPSVPSSELLLDIPEQQLPLCDLGVLTGPLESPREKHRRWKMELGGHPQIGLKIIMAPQNGEQPGLTLVRQNSVYEFAPRGLELISQLTLETLNQPRTNLEVLLDPGLRLAVARVSEQPVEWGVLQEGTADEPTRILVQLPENMMAGSRVLTLEALGDIPLGQRFRLPGIHPADVFWQEGQATLRIPAPLVLEALQPVQLAGQVSGRQIEVGPLPDVPGESVVIQYFHDQAAVEVVVSRRPEQINVLGGTSVNWSADVITGTAKLDFTAVEQQTFSLPLLVSRQWLIDSVVSDPDYLLDDWRYRAAKEGDARLDVQLSKALALDRPVRLVIQGKLLRPPAGEPLPLSDLLMVKFPTARAQLWRLTLRTTGPERLEVQPSEDWKRLDVQQLDAKSETKWRDRLTWSEIQWLLESTSPGGVGSARLLPRRTKYSAEVEVQVAATELATWESYRVLCQPEAGQSLERVLLHLSTTQPRAPEWNLSAAHRDVSLTARLVSAPAGVSSSSGGEFWELRFSPPISGDFEIRGRRACLVPSGPERLVLLDAPEALSPRRTLAVRLAGTTAIELRNHGLVSLPLPSDEAPAGPPLRALFRYDDLPDVAGANYVALVRQAPGTYPALVAWKSQGQASYRTVGPSRHRIAYFLQNLGQRTVGLQLPTEAQDVRATVAGRALPGPFAPPRLTFELPEQNPFPEIVIEFSLPEKEWGPYKRLKLPDVRLKAPVIERSWQVLVPPGHEVLEDPVGWRAPGLAPMTWTKRWFGSWGRAVAWPKAGPSATNWAGYFATARDAAEQRNSAKNFVKDLREQFSARDLLSQTETNGPPAGARGWAKIVESAWTKQERSLPLLVDAATLSLAGIGPQSIPALGLEHASVIVGIHPRAWVLTHRWSAPQESEFPQDHGFVEVPSGSLAERVEAALAGDPTTGLVPWASWVMAPRSPWDEVVLPSGSSLHTDVTKNSPPAYDEESAAWREEPAQGKTYAFFTGGDEELTLDVLQTNAWLTWRYGAFLLALGCMSLLTARGRWLLVGGLLALAAFVPPTWSLVASAACWGSWTWLAWRIVWPGPLWVLPDARPVRSTVSFAAVPARIVLFGLAAGWLLGWGGESGLRAQPLPGTQPGEAFVYPVLIPVDAEKNPVQDEKYQIPTELYRQMTQRVDQLRGKPQGWLWGPVLYEGKLTWQPLAKRYIPGPCKASFDLYVFGPSTRVQLPWNVQGLVEPPGGGLPLTATLDGRACDVTLWTGNEGRLEFDVPAVDRPYRLELDFHPRVQSFEDESEFDLSLPKLPQAQLKWEVPSPLPLLDWPTALGPVRFDEPLQMLTAELGPANRLTARWRDEEAPLLQVAETKVEQLMWLKVLPGSAVLEVKWHYHVLQGAVRRVTLMADSRLRLLRLRPSLTAGEVQLREQPGNPKTYQVNFARPLTGEFTLDTTFLLEGTSGVGNLRLPRVEAVGSDAQVHWLGVTLDSSLEATHAAGQEIPPELFANAWGQPSIRASLHRVFQVAPDQLPWWGLTTRPRAPRKTGDQTLFLSAGRKRVQVKFVAQLTAAGAPSFQHEVSAPPEFILEKLTLEQDGGSRSVRWSRDMQGKVNVLLTAPATGRQTLTLEGSLPWELPARLTLPVFQTEQTELTRSRLVLTRQPGVKVQVEGLTGWQSADPPSPLDPKLGSLLAAYQLAPALLTSPAPKTQGTLVASSVRPQISGIQITTLRRDSGRWRLSLELLLPQVEPGSIESLRWALPAGWAGPEQVPSGWAMQVEKTPGEQRSELVLRPLQALAGDVRVRLEGPATLGTGRDLLPWVAPLGLSKLEQYLVVPSEWEGQVVAWEVPGGQTADLPEQASVPPPGSLVFRATPRRLTASWRVSGRGSRYPRVWLADQRFRAASSTHYRGLTTFSLEPAGEDQCELLLPLGTQPLLIQVNGNPAVAWPTAADRWQILLPSPQEPTQISLLYSGEFPPGWTAWGESRLPVPRLADYPVEKTLWSVSGFLDRLLAPEAGKTTAVDLELERLQLGMQMIDLGMKTSLDPQSPEFIEWSQPWLARLTESQRRLGWPKSETPGLDLPLPADLADWEQRYLAWSEKLPTRVPDSTEPLPFVREGAARLWADNLWPVPLASSWSWAGERTFLRFAAASVPHVHWQWLLSAALAVLTLLTASWSEQDWLRSWLRRWSHAIGICLGLAWWVWLEPSFLGWLLVAICVILSLSGPWQRTWESRSTIRRPTSLSRPKNS